MVPGTSSASSVDESGFLQKSKFLPDTTTQDGSVSTISHGDIHVPTATGESEVRMDEGTVQNITNFSDKADVTSDVSRTPDVSNPVHGYAELNLKDFLERPFPVNVLSWSSTSIAGTLVASVNPLGELFTVESIAQKLANYQYFRAKLEISFRVNATPFHYGRLIASYYPYATLMPGIDFYTNLYTASGFQHVQIEPTSSCTSSMIIPFICPYNYISTKDLTLINSYGSLNIYVLNQLNSTGVPVPPVTVTMWARLVDVELAAPTEDLAQFEGGFVEGLAKTVKGAVTGVAKAIPDVVSTVDVIANAGETLAPLVATMDMPISQQTYSPVILRTPRFANTDGLNNADFLAVSPKNEVSACHDLLGSSVDEMNIMDIIQTPMLIHQEVIGSTYAAGDVITSVNLNPRIYKSFLGFISDAFIFSRGSIRLHFQIVSSNFHSMRLRFAWIPYTLAPNGDMVKYSNLVNTVVDIKTQSEVSIVVPYVADSPWLSNYTAGSDHSLGTIDVQAVSVLTCSVTPIQPIYLNVWMSGGSDYQFALPQPVKPIVVSDFAANFEALDLESIKNADYMPILKSSGYKDTNICMGETVTSLKHLLCRHVYLGLADSRAYFDPYHGSVLTTADNTAAQPSFWSYFAQIFRFMRGSYSCRVVPINDAVTTAAIAPANTENTNRFGNTAFLLETILQSFSFGGELSASRSQVLSVQVPYYFNRNFAFTDKANFTTTIFASRPYVLLGGEDGTKSFVFEAVGDDFTFGQRIGVPRTPTAMATENAEKMSHFLKASRENTRQKQLSILSKRLARLKLDHIDLGALPV